MMGQVLPIERGERPALSLDLPEGLTFEEWVDVGRRLCIGQQAINWHIGDWWAFGDHRYGERAKKAAEGIFGKEFQTLANLASVSRSFEPSRRRELLSFTHHAEVAGLASKQPEVAEQLLSQAAAEGWSKNDLRREVQALKASNDPNVGTIAIDSDQASRGKIISHDLMVAYSWLAKWGHEIEEARELESTESDYLALVLSRLGDAYAERAPVPMDFRVTFREQGRLECERVYGVSRLTVNRWMRICDDQALKDGERSLREDRAAFVKYQRDVSHGQKQAGQPVSNEIDTYLPVARMAADFLRIRRNGGWMISIHECGGWRVGTVQRTSEQLIAMAVNQGFDRDAAVAEARAEGY
jgi:hypothetical protein